MPKNPYTGWSRQRLVSKVKRQYTYTTDTFINRHRPDVSREDNILIGGLILYYGLPAIGSLFNQPILSAFAGLMFVAIVVLPLALKLMDEYKLKSKTSVTQKIIQDNPEHIRPRNALLLGCEFGDALESTDKLNDYIKTNNVKLTSHWRPTKTFPLRAINEEEAKKTLAICEANGWHLYPVKARGDEVAFFWVLPEIPLTVLNPAEARVRAGWGIYKIPHAEIISLELPPISTSIQVKDVIVDVQVAVFVPFVSMYALKLWLKTAEWFMPSPALREFAKFVKRETDHKQNERLFTVSEQERDNATESYNRLLTQRQLEQVQQDNEQGVMRRLPHKKMERNDWLAIILEAIFCLAIGAYLGATYF
jgi:hypothetical protein